MSITINKHIQKVKKVQLKTKYFELKTQNLKLKTTTNNYQVDN